MNTTQNPSLQKTPDSRPLCLRNKLGEIFAALRQITQEEYPADLLAGRRQIFIDSVKIWNTLNR